ncbi:hypothetical protein GLA29479_4013 [Lysobacter antibioticus]|uniref:Uncharacterized protein n=1 Tax=Lysobacter antibioticus TaxID=84531 RepID=A0A0S2FGP1_LYSAN|nr:hypothetical protein GLA29479_4013 [Lysobacter antibioticus]ALN82708.1 hypothetical protein LA76x_4600 [Lysobacter antibioticus]
MRERRRKAGQPVGRRHRMSVVGWAPERAAAAAATGPIRALRALDHRNLHPSRLRSAVADTHMRRRTGAQSLSLRGAGGFRTGWG